jgi:hypothetical protein
VRTGFRHRQVVGFTALVVLVVAAVAVVDYAMTAHGLPSADRGCRFPVRPGCIDRLEREFAARTAAVDDRSHAYGRRAWLYAALLVGALGLGAAITLRRAHSPAQRRTAFTTLAHVGLWVGLLEAALLAAKGIADAPIAAPVIQACAPPLLALTMAAIGAGRLGAASAAAAIGAGRLGAASAVAARPPLWPWIAGTMVLAAAGIAAGLAIEVGCALADNPGDVCGRTSAAWALALLPAAGNAALGYPILRWLGTRGSLELWALCALIGVAIAVNVFL